MKFNPFGPQINPGIAPGKMPGAQINPGPSNFLGRMRFPAATGFFGDPSVRQVMTYQGGAQNRRPLYGTQTNWTGSEGAQDFNRKVR